jgi:hypothetical protein
VNVYGFVGNNGVCQLDLFGLWEEKASFKGSLIWYFNMPGRILEKGRHIPEDSYLWDFFNAVYSFKLPYGCKDDKYAYVGAPESFSAKYYSLRAERMGDKFREMFQITPGIPVFKLRVGLWLYAKTEESTQFSLPCKNGIGTAAVKVVNVYLITGGGFKISLSGLWDPIKGVIERKRACASHIQMVTCCGCEVDSKDIDVA